MNNTLQKELNHLEVTSNQKDILGNHLSFQKQNNILIEAIIELRTLLAIIIIGLIFACAGVLVILKQLKLILTIIN